MAGNGFNDRWVEELKSKCDILTVIGKYTRLTRKGRSYWGLCPFHHEKTPSFCVNEQGQFYHCFGCGVGGDVVKFVMNIENVSFKEAVEMLADRAKMELPQDDEVVDVERVKLKERLYKMNVDTAKYFHQNLLSSKNAIEYLKENGILAVSHYVPLHSAPAGQKFGRFHGEDVYTTKESERLCRLPMYYRLQEEQVDYIISKVKEFYA